MRGERGRGRRGSAVGFRRGGGEVAVKVFDHVDRVVSLLPVNCLEPFFYVQ